MPRIILQVSEQTVWSKINVLHEEIRAKEKKITQAIKLFSEGKTLVGVVTEMRGY